MSSIGMAVQQTVKQTWSGQILGPLFQWVNPPIPTMNPDGSPFRVGQNFSFEVQVQGGVAPYSFSASGLPGGINLTQAAIDQTKALLSGTFTQAQSFDAEITAVDSAGQQIAATFASAR